MRWLITAFSIFFIPLLLGLTGVAIENDNAQQHATPTPIGIYGVLLDTNALIYCQIVQEPIPDIFQTATAVISPTATTIALRTPTPSPFLTITPYPTPSQEFAATPTIAPLTTTMYVKVNALNVRNAASTSGSVQYVVTLNQAVRVTANQVTNQGYVWRELNDGLWLVEKVVSTGAVWLSATP